MHSDPLDHATLLVAGSVNLDHRLSVSPLPSEGATVLASAHVSTLGGKGANQAVAASLTGVKTIFVADVGVGIEAESLTSMLGEFPLDLRLAQSEIAPGQAWVQVDEQGKNLITVLPGANGRFRSKAVVDVLDSEESIRFVVLQGEVPASSIREIIRGASTRGTEVVLNLAPPIELDPETISKVSVLILNEHEAEFLARRPLRFEVDEELVALREELGVATLVVTLGAQGAVLSSSEGTHRAPAKPVTRVVDTVGAGDAFVGVFSAALASGVSAKRSLELAANVASDTTQREGAATSYVPVSLDG